MHLVVGEYHHQFETNQHGSSELRRNHGSVARKDGCNVVGVGRHKVVEEHWGVEGVSPWCSSSIEQVLGVILVYELSLVSVVLQKANEGKYFKLGIGLNRK